tara:strand:- start:3875 stop:4777 length:903 start_codon:yes stop_codon:yes gene_type:complete
MSDYDEFKSVLAGFEKSIEYECSDPDLINSIFKDIRDMVEAMIQKRDKELEKKPTPKVSSEPVDKPEKVCPPGKIVNPKTGRCINKPKEKTQKRRGRPKKFDKPEEQEEPKPPTDKPEKECPPGKIVNPKTGRCINKPKEKTHKRRGRPKKSVSEEVKTVPMPEPEPKPKPKKSMNFDEALEHIRTNGKPGSYRTFLNGIKRKFGITLKYDNHGDDYAVPDLYFMKGKKECSREEMEKVMKYVIDTAEKQKSPPVSNYYQKQYEKFMKTTDKDDLKEAFVEKVEPEPEKVPRYNLRGMDM